MRKLLMLLFMGMFLINLTSALDSQGVGKEGDNFTFIQTCDDATYITLSTIQYPNRTVQIINENMSDMGGKSYQYNFTDTVTGRYDITGISDGCTNTFATYFEVTYSGKVMSSSNAILYVPIYLLLGFLFVITIYGINALPNYNATDEEGKIIKISYLKYLRSVLYFVLWMFVVAVFYISSNLAFAYLPDTLIANFFLMLLKISYGLTLPIIVIWFIYIFAQIIDDKKIKSLWERGMFPSNF